MGVAWDAVPRAGNAAPYAPPGQTFEAAVVLKRASSMKSSLRIVLVISLLLVSCAKHPVTQDTVEVADTYSGHIRLTPCIQGAQEPVVLDVSDDGNTVACPLGGVRTVVIKHPKNSISFPKMFMFGRSGDGSPVMITAEIP